MSYNISPTIQTKIKRLLILNVGNSVCHFIALYCASQMMPPSFSNKWKARHSTSKIIMTRFVAVLALLQWARTKPTVQYLLSMPVTGTPSLACDLAILLLWKVSHRCAKVYIERYLLRQRLWYQKLNNLENNANVHYGIDWSWFSKAMGGIICSNDLTWK